MCGRVNSGTGARTGDIQTWTLYLAPAPRAYFKRSETRTTRDTAEANRKSLYSAHRHQTTFLLRSAGSCACEASFFVLGLRLLLLSASMAMARAKAPRWASQSQCKAAIKCAVSSRDQLVEGSHIALFYSVAMISARFAASSFAVSSPSALRAASSRSRARALAAALRPPRSVARPPPASLAPGGDGGGVGGRADDIGRCHGADRWAARGCVCDRVEIGETDQMCGKSRGSGGGRG